MNITQLFLRFFFTILSVFFLTTYMTSGPGGATTANFLVGIGSGLALAAALFGFDVLFKRFNLRSFNISIIGLFIGYLMGQALVIIFEAVLDISAASIQLAPTGVEIISIALFLFGLYLGSLMTLRAADELYVSIPFVRFTPMAQKKRDMLVDASVLADARILDLAASGLLDHHLVLPRFLVKDLYAQAEVGDEAMRSRARRALDAIKKLETMQELELRINDTDFPDVKDFTAKLIRLARLLDANLLTADISRVQIASVEGVRIINLHALSNALKPLMQAGEHIKIKVQRLGKEPNQGVGYLEDGTMVVINGGGAHVNKMIEVLVLSVKHTSSGRMIFCNTLEEEERESDEDEKERDE